VRTVTLVEAPRTPDLRGAELVGLKMTVEPWRNFDAQYESFLKGVKDGMSNRLASLVSLETGEKTVWKWEGLNVVPAVDNDGNPGLAEHDGQLFLTALRLIWVQNGLFSFEIPLEDISALTLAQIKVGNDKRVGVSLKSAKRNVDVLLRLWIWYHDKVKTVEAGTHPNAFEKIRDTILGQQQIKRDDLQREKQKERVQLVFDFSSLRETLQQGGIVMTTFKCPQCSATQELPETGKVIVCRYCGTPIRPVDIFEKIKTLLA
jgi:hypothetical protein